MSFWSDPEFYARAIPIVVITFGVLTGAWHIGKRVARAMRRAVHLVDDLAGEPAREGVPARPGVMTRLATLEDRTEVLVNRVGDTGPIARLDLRITAVEARLSEVEQRVREN